MLRKSSLQSEGKGRLQSESWQSRYRNGTEFLGHARSWQVLTRVPKAVTRKIAQAFEMGSRRHGPGFQTWLLEPLRIVPVL